MTEEELDAAVDVIAAVDAGVLESLISDQARCNVRNEEGLQRERQGRWSLVAVKH